MLFKKAGRILPPGLAATSDLAKLAEELIGDRLEDEACRRAVDGITQHKFTKAGDPILHPTMCECGHGLDIHAKYSEENGEPQPRPCEHPECDAECAGFHGRPYVERVYSDRLLETLLKAQFPEKYGTKLQIHSLIANLDFGRLPDPIIARLMAGEDPLVVLGTMAADAIAALGDGE